jgi:hypothetical protein
MISKDGGGVLSALGEAMNTEEVTNKAKQMNMKALVAAPYFRQDSLSSDLSS